MNDAYSSHTGEHIATDTPAAWMGRAGTPAPEYSPQTHGCFWRGGRWEVVAAEPEAAPVPAVITSAQGKLALIELGFFDAARAYLDSIVDPVEKLKAQIEWDRPTWERPSPFLNATWAALGGTSESLDDAFRLAVTL